MTSWKTVLFIFKSTVVKLRQVILFPSASKISVLPKKDCLSGGLRLPSSHRRSIVTILAFSILTVSHASDVIEVAGATVGQKSSIKITFKAQTSAIVSVIRMILI